MRTAKENEPRVAFLPLGGSTLKDWVQEHYLKELGRPEVHIYDRDKKEYKEHCNRVNERKDGSCAFRTKKREMENYLHPDAIKEVLNIEVTFGDDDDVPMLVAKAIHESDPSSKPWDQVDEKKIKEKVRNAKKRLNTEVVARMTYDRLRERDPEGEIEGWLKKIKELLS